MSIAITLSLPAFITPPVLAAATIAVGVGVIAYGAYKLIQRRKANNVVTTENKFVKAAKAKAKLIFAAVVQKVRHHWLMLAGAMPNWMFYIVGQVSSKTAGSTIRSSVRGQSFPVVLVGTILGHVVEVIGTTATDITTIYHPFAVQYRVEYKARMKAIRTVN